MIVETATLSEAEIAEYCRKKGLYSEQLIPWKQAFLQVTVPEDKVALKQNHKDIGQLEKELTRKGKDLAKAAAILVLRKKLTDYYREIDGDG